MKSVNFNFFAERAYFGRYIDLRIKTIDESGEPRYAQKITFESLPEAEYVHPAMRLDQSEAEALMNELWQAGVRPSNGEGSTGQLAATERHLADMRSIAMLKVGVKL